MNRIKLVHTNRCYQKSYRKENFALKVVQVYFYPVGYLVPDYTRTNFLSDKKKQEILAVCLKKDIKKLRITTIKYVSRMYINLAFL